MSPSATLSSEYHISTDLGLNPGVRVERPATIRIINHVTLVFVSSVTCTKADIHLQCLYQREITNCSKEGETVTSDEAGILLSLLHASYEIHGFFTGNKKRHQYSEM